MMHKTDKKNFTPSPKDFVVADGVIEELLPGAKFRVKLSSGQEVLGHLAGRLRMHKIRILPGDKVKMEISPYDLTKGRITYRY